MKFYPFIKNQIIMRTKRRGMRMTQRPRLSMKLRQRAIIVASLLIMVSTGAMVAYLNLSSPKEVYAAVNGEYRSKTSGNWSSSSTWEKYNGTSWVAATAGPTSSDNITTIQNGHTVTVTANVTTDQLVINNGATLTINSGITLTIGNGSGVDCDISGTLTCTGTLNASGGSTIEVEAGGKYRHNKNGSSIVIATWKTGSTCEVTGVTSTVPDKMDQSFHNLVWNCPSQSVNINLNDKVRNVGGDLRITSTNSSKLFVADKNTDLNVNGDFVQTGGTFVLAYEAAKPGEMTVNGNYIQSGGTFSVVTGLLGTGTVNIKGDFSHTGGTIDVGGLTGTATINFNKSGTQVFTASSNTVSGNIDYIVKNGSTLDLGTSVVKGRNFTVESNAGLIIGSTAGITSLGNSGNVQVSLLRSFHSGATYIYKGSSSQVTGNGLPGTVSKLTVNTSGNLTLSSTTSVSSLLTFLSGKIVTGSNELRVTSTSTTAIAGHSTSSYVVGNLRRSVSSSGSYDFPIGTSSNYEFINANLSSTSGFSTLLATFNSASPVASIPLLGIGVAGYTVRDVLDCGYWSLTPNLIMLSGSYSVTIKAKGQTNAAPYAYNYAVIKRDGILSKWESVGTHTQGTQTQSGGIVTAVRSGLKSFSDFAIAYSDGYYGFVNPTLISGVNGQVGAVYRFDFIGENIDGWLQILSLNNGATLANVDHFTDGYEEAWQPYVAAPANSTSSITWRMTFKVTGTSTDTVIQGFAVTALDVDGDGGSLREFVEANTIYSYSLSTGSNLIVTNNNGSYRAISTVANVPNIDTTRQPAMFQLNFQNRSNFEITTGSVSTYHSSQIRQNSFYFKPFFSGHMALPVELTGFTAKLYKDEVHVAWSTASEINNDYFTVERSQDGKNFTVVGRVKGSGNISYARSYQLKDPDPLTGTSYYRLKQTDFNGKTETFQMVSITNGKGNVSGATDQAETACSIKSIYPNPVTNEFNLRIESASRGQVEAVIIQTNGAVVKKMQLEVNEGESEHRFTNLGSLTPGIYFVRVISGGQTSQMMKIVKR